MANFIVEFDKAFKAAIVSAENINEDGSINWNFVDSDCFIALNKIFGKQFDLKLYCDEFEFAADEYDSFREAGVA